MFIAIGGGGFIPARILRTQLKNDVNGKKRNIPIQAVGLVLYEDMGGVSNYFLLRFFPVKVLEFGRMKGDKNVLGSWADQDGTTGTCWLSHPFYLFTPFL